MSEEKTEQPTDKKLRDALKKGSVGKSSDLVSACTLMGVFAVIAVFWRQNFDSMIDLINLVIENLNRPFHDNLRILLIAVFWKAAMITIPVLGIAVVLVFAANILQFGFIVTFEPITPNFAKLNPVEGFKRIFSMNTVIDCLKSIIKVTFLCILFYNTIKDSIPSMVQVAFWDVEVVGVLISKILIKLISLTVVFFLFVAGFDVLLQKFMHRRKNKMSKDEVKREYKEMEGDPQIKGTRRQLHQELIEEDRSMRLAKATLVVAGSRDIAVALFYHRIKNPLPMVIAKGRDNEARKIVMEAEQSSIPVFQDSELAEQLYREIEQKQYISRAFFKPIAALIRQVEAASRQGYQDGCEYE